MALPTRQSLALDSIPSEFFEKSPGTNRATSNNPQVSARNDLEALTAFLATYADSAATFANYRKEIERLLLWAVRQQGKLVSSLTHEDLLSYQHFLKDPQPYDLWVTQGGRRFARSDVRWRPFSGALSPSSQRQAFVILNVMFTWLVDAGYLAGNPLSLTRQRRTNPKARITRCLDEELWSHVKQSVDRAPRETERQRRHYFRTRWLFSLFYLGGLRVSEVGENTMGAFFRRRGADGMDRWWLEVHGKGGKTRLVPAGDELISELSRYRRETGLTTLPVPGDTNPLVLPLGSSRRPLTRAAIHLVVKSAFERAASELRQRGAEYEAAAEHLSRASAHWLRHTAGTHMANESIDLRYVRDNLGHASLTTTSIYLHSDDDRRHDETAAAHRIRWTEEE